MVRALTFAIPGDINTVTGGYLYDRRVICELRKAGIAVNHCELPASFPFPDTADTGQTVSQLNATRADAPLIIDGLAFGAIPHDSARRLRPGIVAMCHHPLGLETGLSDEKAAWFLANEKANLQLADCVVATSKTTAATLHAELDVPLGKLVVAEPGTDAMPRSQGGERHVVELLGAGSLIERKGQDVLIHALAGMRGQPWRLRLVGSPDRDRAFAAKLKALIAGHDLGAQIELTGEIPRADLEQLYATCDVFVLASRYEGYGMVLAEALASGLAIVSTTGGAAAQTVPDAAAIKVPPGDVAALRAALQRVVGDTDLRTRLAEHSWEAGQMLPRWNDTAAIIASALDHVKAGKPS